MTARPQRVGVELDSVDARAAEGHRAEAAVADGQRLQPLRGRRVVPRRGLRIEDSRHGFGSHTGRLNLGSPDGCVWILVIITSGVLDTLRYCVEVVCVHVDVQGQKRVHTRPCTEYTLNPSRECLRRFDVVCI